MRNPPETSSIAARVLAATALCACTPGTEGRQQPAALCGISPAQVVSPGPSPEPPTPIGVRGVFPAPGFGPTIDVVVVYTPAARSAAGGAAQIEDTILDWVRQANTIFYPNSFVAHTLRVVGLTETPYVEGADALTDLTRLQTPNDGFMEDALALRARVGGDLVHLVSLSRGFCGIAYLLGRFDARTAEFAVAVSNLTCGSGVFAHEIGHNLGCAHEQGDPIPGSYCFSRGYVTPNGVLRDLMANTLSQPVPVFSSPLVRFNGVVMGEAATTSLPCQGADTARTMNLTSPMVAGFRSSPTPAEAPAPFDLAAPAPGAAGVSPAPTLRWRFAEGAERYEVTLSERADLSAPLLTRTIAQGVEPLRVSVPFGAVRLGGTYWWSVAAINAAGARTGSGQAASFRVRPPGDANGDGMVNFLDLSLVITQLFESGPPNAQPGAPAGDVNYDGVVNFLDLGLVLAGFGG